MIHARRVHDTATGPRVGLIIAKSVGTAVQRHRVARRLRHVVRDVLDELEPSDQMVIRALPGSSQVESSCLQEQLHAGLQRIRRNVDR